MRFIAGNRDKNRLLLGVHGMEEVVGSNSLAFNLAALNVTGQGVFSPRRGGGMHPISRYSEVSPMTHSMIGGMIRSVLAVTLFANGVAAQTPTATPDLPSLLNALDQSAQQAAVQIAALRIEKWKTEGEVRQQAQANADSLQRNLTTALPALTATVRSAPQDLTAVFKLYRNVNALGEVLNSLAESAGAFGKKEEFQVLQRSAQDLDQARRSLADYLENLVTQKEAELQRLRAAAHPAGAATLPHKVIVDNDPAPIRKSTKKKLPVKPQ